MGLNVMNFVCNPTDAAPFLWHFFFQYPKGGRGKKTEFLKSDDDENLARMRTLRQQVSVDLILSCCCRGFQWVEV